MWDKGEEGKEEVVLRDTTEGNEGMHEVVHRGD